MEKKTNCWVPVDEVEIPAVYQKGFKDKIIIRKKVQPIIVQRKETTAYVEPVVAKTLKQDEYNGEDFTVLLRQNEYDGEEETVLLVREIVEEASVTRLKDGESVKIDKERFVIGKSNTADYVIKDNPTISRQHVAITKNEEGYYLEDLSSSNHTYVDEKEITKPVKLVEGMTFKLAEEEFRFSIKITC